jgi:alpha-1,2-mannosyltransferase
MLAMLAILVMPLLALPLLGPFVLPLLSRIFGSFFGWCLAKKTQGRRAQLLALMDEDEEKYQQEKRSEGATEGEDRWEDIEHPAGSSKNGEKDTGAWTGIVGFFHPFW